MIELIMIASYTSNFPISVSVWQCTRIKEVVTGHFPEIIEMTILLPDEIRVADSVELASGDQPEGLIRDRQINNNALLHIGILHKPNHDLSTSGRFAPDQICVSVIVAVCDCGSFPGCADGIGYER